MAKPPGLDGQMCPKCGQPATEVRCGDRPLMAGENGWKPGIVVRVPTWRRYFCNRGHDWAPPVRTPA